MCNRVLRIKFERLAKLGNRMVVPSRKIKDHTLVCMKNGRVWIELSCEPQLLERFVVASGRREEACRHVASVHIARVELKCPPEILFRSGPVPVVIAQNVCHRGVRFREVPTCRECAQCRCFCFWEHVTRRYVAIRTEALRSSRQYRCARARSSDPTRELLHRFAVIPCPSAVRRRRQRSSRRSGRKTWRRTQPSLPARAEVPNH